MRQRAFCERGLRWVAARLLATAAGGVGNACSLSFREAPRLGRRARRHLSRPRRRGRACIALRRHHEAMQLYLEEISRHVAEGAHAVLLLDRAGSHTTAKRDVPCNITPIFLPSRAPELNPVENIWQFLRGNGLSNLVFETYDDIINAALRHLAQTRRPARNNHLHRNVRPGPHRSDPMTLGIGVIATRSCCARGGGFSGQRAQWALRSEQARTAFARSTRSPKG
jgi:hypothetical protein